MRWQAKWRALAARFDGLSRAGELVASTLYGGSDPNGVVGNAVMPEIARLRVELAEFVRTYRQELPPEAAAAYDRFSVGPLFSANTPERYGLALVVPWAVLRSELEYLLRDPHQEARSQTELAFEHLRPPDRGRRGRPVEVDGGPLPARDQVREARGGPPPEPRYLGVQGLGNRRLDGPCVRRPGRAPHNRGGADRARPRRDGVEIVRQAGEAETKAAEAREQLRRYRQGVLADMTLTSTRYVVLVSAGEAPAPPNVVDGDVTYRHIMIRVEPVTPSAAARATTRAPRGKGG